MATSASKLNQLAVALVAQTPDDVISLRQRLVQISEEILKFEQRKEDAMWAGNAEKANGIGYQIILRQVARKELRRRIKAKTKESKDELQKMQGGDERRNSDGADLRWRSA